MADKLRIENNASLDNFALMMEHPNPNPDDDKNKPGGKMMKKRLGGLGIVIIAILFVYDGTMGPCSNQRPGIRLYVMFDPSQSNTIDPKG